MHLLPGWTRWMLLFVGAAALAAAEAPPLPLAWEETSQRRELPAGTDGADFVFVATNTGSEALRIARVLTSCECLSAEPPDAPWIIAPGASVRLSARLDLLDRSGEVTHQLWIEADGFERQTLTVTAVLPRRGVGSR